MADAKKTATEQPRRRGPGRPFVPGDPRINKTGRPRGRRAKLDAMLAKVGTSTPLETLLELMHTAKDQATRLKAAAAAAPYCHPRLLATEHGFRNLAEGDEGPRRFTLRIFDNRGQRVLPPPRGDERQKGTDGSDEDPAAI
jgi:hypothetical protein